MGMDDELVWLSYADAAKRVSSSVRTVNRWAAAGMQVEWRTDDAGQKFRVVEESVLLAWWRDRLKASPVHFYRMRRKLIEEGETPPPVPDRFRPTRKPSPERAHAAIQPQPRTSQVSAEGETAESTSTAFARVLAELPEFTGYRQYATLIAAMEDHPPACDGLEVFTADRFDDPEQTDMMRGICRDCPLLQLCEAFAAAGKPAAGMWAGRTPGEVRRLSGTRGSRRNRGSGASGQSGCPSS